MQAVSGIGSTDVWYPEHENLNSYRNYPFAEAANLEDTDGVALAEDIFVDAFLYPVVSAPTAISLTRFRMPDGYVEISGEEGVLVSGTHDDDSGTVELYDARGRHSGTIICGPGWEREKASGRDRTFDGLAFSSVVCAPVVFNGVLSVSNEDGTERTTRRNIVFQGDDQIIPHLEGNRLWFDALPKAEDPSYQPPIRTIVFANSGATPIRVDKPVASLDLPSMVLPNTVEVLGFGFDREDVCWQAHKEDAVVLAVDTCEDKDKDASPCTPQIIPEDHTEHWICADSMGFINIVATDYINYKNPVVVSTVSGQTVPRVAEITPGLSQEEMIVQGSKLSAKPITSGNGIRISIPGLKG